MAFFEERLPDCYTFGARGGPMFSTEVVTTAGGQQFANQNWTLPLARYDISSGIKTRVDFEELQAFFYNVGGRRDGFRFKAWPDFEGEDQPSVLLTGSTYQMQRAYVKGARTFLRTIYKPVSGTIFIHRITSGGVVSLISPTIDYTNGQFTVTGHSTGDRYRWTGEFDLPVRFGSDVMEAEVVNKKGSTGELLIGWPNVQVTEIRQP